MRRKEFLKSMGFLTFGALFKNSEFKFDHLNFKNFAEVHR